MQQYWIDVFGLLLRCLHVVAAIAWIGESFYFVALDRGLLTAEKPLPGLVGESWSVHGGGFYHKQKYLPAPARLPEVLHWSMWKSYTTWLSGLALFTLIYLLQPTVYLIDPAVAALSSSQAVLLALAFPLLGWLIYDGLCRWVGFNDRLLGALIGLAVLALAYAATHCFAGRAAFLLVGAVLGTLMTANVFFLIIPGQRRMVGAIRRGELPNPLDGERGKQRSVHNTYFTLPVVFAMLSNHFASSYAHSDNWVLLVLLMAAAALIRQFFVVWHSGDRAWGLLLASTGLLLAAFWWLAPKVASVPKDAALTAVELASIAQFGRAPTTAAILPIFKARCALCHSAQPKLMAAAPKGAMFDQVEQIEARAVLIYQQVAVLKVMPPGNLSGLTEPERAAIERWYLAR